MTTIPFAKLDDPGGGKAVVERLTDAISRAGQVLKGNAEASAEQRQAASMFLCWPTNAVDLAKSDETLPKLVDELAKFIARREALALTALQDRVRVLEEAGRNIAGGHFQNASTLAVSGAWRDFAIQLQEIARAALTAASSPDREIRNIT